MLKPSNYYQGAQALIFPIRNSFSIRCGTITTLQTFPIQTLKIHQVQTWSQTYKPELLSDVRFQRQLLRVQEMAPTKRMVQHFTPYSTQHSTFRQYLALILTVTIRPTSNTNSLDPNHRSKIFKPSYFFQGPRSLYSQTFPIRCGTNKATQTAFQQTGVYPRTMPKRCQLQTFFPKKLITRKRPPSNP